MKKAPLSKGSEYAAVLRTSLYYIGSVRSWQAEQTPRLMATAGAPAQAAAYSRV